MTRDSVIEYKIRIRDGLRRWLETAAKKRDVSINQEMATRLEKSFEHGEMLKLGKITADLENVYSRYATWLSLSAQEQRDRQRGQLQTQELIDAAEALIELLPAEIQDRKSVKRGIVSVQEAIAAIARVHGRTLVLRAGEMSKK